VAAMLSLLSPWAGAGLRLVPGFPGVGLLAFQAYQVVHQLSLLERQISVALIELEAASARQVAAFRELMSLPGNYLAEATQAILAGAGLIIAAGAVGLQPAVPGAARATLRRLPQTAIDKRSAMLAAIGGRLRAGLPKVLARSPSRLEHSGFTSLDQMVAHVLAETETPARTAADFNRRLKGRRRNVAGRLLFERPAKFHPGLGAFPSGLAPDLSGPFASEAGQRSVTLVDGTGATRRVTPGFGAPRKVAEFKLRGAGGVARAYTGFGSAGRNKQGLRGGLLIEIKMPAALAAVAGQSGEFLPRLQEAQELIIVFPDETGTPAGSLPARRTSC
jgi:hypothetical protein